MRVFGYIYFKRLKFGPFAWYISRRINHVLINISREIHVYWRHHLICWHICSHVVFFTVRRWSFYRCDKVKIKRSFLSPVVHSDNTSLLSRVTYKNSWSNCCYFPFFVWTACVGSISPIKMFPLFPALSPLPSPPPSLFSWLNKGVERGRLSSSPPFAFNCCWKKKNPLDVTGAATDAFLIHIEMSHFDG